MSRWTSGTLAMAALVAVVLMPTPARAAAPVMYEDGSDGDIDPWFAHPAGTIGVVSNVTDDDPAHGQAIQFTGDGAERMVFYAPAANPWDFPAHPILQWDFRYQGKINFLIMLQTDTAGMLYLSYASDNTPGWRGNTIYYKLDPALADGAWHAGTRNLQQDVAAFAPGATVLTLEYFSVYGAGKIDNLQLTPAEPLATVSGAVLDGQGNPVADAYIAAPRGVGIFSDAAGRYALPGLSPGNHTLTLQKQLYQFPATTVTVSPVGSDITQDITATQPAVVTSIMYEDGSDGNTDPWLINPAGATSVVQNVADADPAHGSVIDLTADAPTTRLVFYASAENPWNFLAFPVLQWDMKYQSKANALVMIQTDNVAINNGVLYLSYATDNTPGWRGNTFYYQLDPSVADGAWHTITRNLQQDVAVFAPGANVQSVQYFSVYGTGRLDNLLLRNDAPLAVVSGTVTDEQNNPLAGVIVSAPPMAVVTVTDASGAYTLPGLPPGDYALQLQQIGYLFPSPAFTIDAAGTNQALGVVGGALPRSAPVILQLTSPAPDSLQLTIDPATNAAAVTYAIFDADTNSYLQADGAWGAITTRGEFTFAELGAAAGRTFTGFTPDSQHTLVAGAVNADDSLVNSAPVTVRTQPAPPAPPATADGGGRNFFASGGSSPSAPAASASVFAPTPSVPAASSPAEATASVAPAPTAPEAVLGERVSRLDDLIANTKFGDRNELVRELQTELQTRGFFPGALNPTGYYGPITRRGVQVYQASALSLEELLARARRGECNPLIERLQTELRTMGFFPRWVRSTGFYGPITAESVAKYRASLLATTP